MGAWEKDQEDYVGAIDILPLLRDKLLVMRVGEKDHEDYVGVIPILLSLETNHWHGLQRTGSSAVSQSGSPLHHEAASDAESVVMALYGSIWGFHHNVKLFCFNLCFVVLVSEQNSKYNIVSSILSYFIIPLQKGLLQRMLRQM